MRAPNEWISFNCVELSAEAGLSIKAEKRVMAVKYFKKKGDGGKKRLIGLNWSAGRRSLQAWVRARGAQTNGRMPVQDAAP